MLSKDQIHILQVCTANITKRFTIRGIAKQLHKDPAQIHKSIQPLIKQNYLLKTPENHLMLNYKLHHTGLAYIEHLRAVLILKRHSTLNLFLTDVVSKIKDEYFILVLFGSIIKESKPRDIDVLVIVNKDVESYERFLSRIANLFTLHLDINVISVESVYEMATKRDEANLFNEVLDKHVIIYGGESFYRLLTHARR